MAVVKYLKEVRQLSLLGKLLNIRSTEWRRVFLSWLLLFLYRSGFVVGWTVLIAMFVGRYGIASLPYLFVLHALFSVLGSVIYSVFIDRFKIRKLLIFSLLMAAGLLSLAFGVSSLSIEWFFALVIVGEAVFLMQFRILLTGFFEEMFTPLESERTFPIIESSETLGGIFGGLIIVGFASNFNMPDFSLLWIALILFAVPLLLLSERVLDDLAFFKTENEKNKRPIGIITKVKREFKKAKQYGFLRNLMLIVLLHWLLFNLLEFQYTKAVYSNVSEVVLDTGSGLEHMLVHDLGVLFMIFSTSALLLQLFVAGRLIGSLGVVGSMILHPLIAMFSLLGFTAFFNFFTAVLARNNFTMSTVLYNNTYHISYYAVADKLRGHTREVLEGMVRPLGALVGTLLLIFLQFLFEDSSLVFAINLTMLLVAILMILVLYFQQNNYTESAVKALVESKNINTRVNAVSILAQRGHKGRLDAMIKVLLNEREPVFLRVKILRAFGQMCDLRAIPAVLKTFESSSSFVREAAIDCLTMYSKLKEFSRKHLFLGYEILESLKTLYSSETDRHLRLKIVAIIARMSSVATLEHLLKLLKTTRGDFKGEVIYALGEFRDDSVYEYVYPYLNSGNLLQKINAAIVLSKFDESREMALHVVSEFMHSSSSKRLELACYALGELNDVSRYKFLVGKLNSRYRRVVLAAAIALAKMGYDDSVQALVKLLFESNDLLVKEIKHMLQNVDVRIRKNLDKMVRHLVSIEISRMMDKNRGKSLHTLSSSELKKLRQLYSLVGEYNEVERIDCISKT